MKTSSRRLSKLRKMYRSRAQRARLRLTDKRIRRLERKRKITGRTFEATWRTYKKDRVRHSAARLAKKHGIKFDEALTLRKVAVKEHTSFREAYNEYAVLPVEAPMPERAPYLEFTQLSYESLYNEIWNLRDRSEKDDLPINFFVSITFGPVEYIGDVEEIDMTIFKEHGDEVYEGHSPWWGHMKIVHSIETPNVSLIATISEQGEREIDEIQGVDETDLEGIL